MIITKKISKSTEELEKIDAMGQESEKKGAKWVIEEGTNERKAEDAKEADELERLHSKRKQPTGYAGEIVAAASRRLLEFDIPKGFDWGVYKTKQGRGIELRYMRPDRRIFARGMYVSYNPNVDINWIIRNLHNAVDEMEKYDRILHPQDYDDLKTQIIV